MISSEVVHPGELAEHPANSNTHNKANIEELAESRRLFDQYKNIIVWSPPEEITVQVNGDEHTLKPSIRYVIAGNGFHQASILRGDDSIEVKDYSHLSYEEALLLMETDNASPLGSERNPGQMAANLERARALVVDNERMSRMLERAKKLAGVNGNSENAGADTEPQIDKAEELRQKWGVESGQLWAMGEHRLICGDCTAPAVVDRVMGGEVVRLEFSDPPYDFETKGGGILSNASHMDAIEKAGISDFNPLTLKLIAKTSVFCCNRPLIKKYIQFADNKGLNWDVGFYKKPNPIPNYSGHLMTDIEYLMILGDQHPNSGLAIEYYSKAYYGNLEEKAEVFPWSKPVGLVEKFVKLYGNKDDVVVDRFLGSGTTIIACQNLNRRCRAIEIDPGYCAVTLERWHQHTSQTPELLS